MIQTWTLRLKKQELNTTMLLVIVEEDVAKEEVVVEAGHKAQTTPVKLNAKYVLDPIMMPPFAGTGMILPLLSLKDVVTVMLLPLDHLTSTPMLVPQLI
jgi:hypothetical protein